MTTADWALIISCGSLLVSLAGFVWNIWSKFIYPKPKLKVSVSIMSMMPNPYKQPSFVCLHATNHGPAELTLYAAIAASKTSFLRRNKIALLNPLKNFPSEFDTSDGPFSGGLPKKIGVGEQFSVYFPLSKEWVSESLTYFVDREQFSFHA